MLWRTHTSNDSMHHVIIVSSFSLIIVLINVNLTSAAKWQKQKFIIFFSFCLCSFCFMSCFVVQCKTDFHHIVFLLFRSLETIEKSAHRIKWQNEEWNLTQRMLWEREKSRKSRASVDWVDQLSIEIIIRANGGHLFGMRPVTTIENR